MDGAFDFEGIAREAAENARRRGNGHADAAAAAPDAPWGDPEPLADAGGQAEPFPVDLLPAGPRDAVEEYQAYGQQPPALVACSALAAMSLACQGLVDVARDGQLVGPSSLFLCVVAQSGERKSAVDRAFLAGAERWAGSEARRLAGEIKAAQAAREAHDAEKAGILAALRDAGAGKGKKDPGGAGPEQRVADLKQKLRDHARSSPPPVPYPTPLVEDATAEGIANVLRHRWPSCALSSAEGGTVVGGHGFSDDARMRTLAFLNSRWDGAPFDRARAAEDHARNHGRRLTVNVMVQPQAFDRFVEAGEGMARGLGTLARFLVARPPSTMGTRFRDPEEPDGREMPALERFLARAEELLRRPLPMPFDMERMAVVADGHGDPPPDPLELKPAVLPLDREARRAWIDYLNETERELAPEGEYAEVRDVAAKSAENACRLAAVFHCWAHGPAGEVGAEAMRRGVGLARWFLREARRVLTAAREDEAAADAELLARWLAAQAEPATLQQAAQSCPYRLRDKDRRENAFAVLAAKRWARREEREGRTVLALNPALRWEA